MYIKNHGPDSKIQGDQRLGVQTRRKFVGISSCTNLDFLSQVEPKKS